jgi:hypothetical protein
MTVTRTPCEWDPDYIRVTEQFGDAACPVYIRFERREPAPAPRVILGNALELLVRLSDILAKNLS